MNETLRVVTVRIFSAIFLFAFALNLALAESRFELMMMLAEQGNSIAQYNLGVMYVNGKGVPENDVEAVKWYRKAAEQGHAVAQVTLGGRYYLGKGVPGNYVQAYKWWNLAAAQGDKTAKRNYNMIRKYMTQSQIEKAQALSSAFKPVKSAK